MIVFDTTRTSFGRHETFPLRFGWLTKGYRAYSADSAVFSKDDATVTLGVGKNMVSSIKYWLEASRIINRDPNAGVSELGFRIFSPKDGWDPYLEDETTLWLVHWLIASNVQDATTFYWFFNRFHKPEFTSAELFSGLQDFVREQLKSKTSDATLRNDVAVLLRMYIPSVTIKSAAVEDSFDSPLAHLGLVQRSIDNVHASRIGERRRLPVAAFGYAVMEVFDATEESSIPLRELAKGNGRCASPGTVFRLSEEGLVAKLEELIRWYPNAFELRESAGIYELYRLKKDITKYALLQKHYARLTTEKAA